MAARDVKQFLLEIKFQKQGQMKGDTQAVHGPLDFKKGLMCHAFEYSVASQFDAGSGQLTGRRIHKPIRIVREVDSASPLIWQALCTNEAIQTATISFARPQATQGAAGTGQLVLHTTIAITGGAIVKYRSWHGVLPGATTSSSKLPRTSSKSSRWCSPS